MNEGLSEGTQAGFSTRLDVRRRNGDSPQKRSEWWCAKRRSFLTLGARKKKKKQNKKNDEREGGKKKKKTAVRLQKQGRRRLQTAKQRRTHGWSSCASGLQDE